MNYIYLCYNIGEVISSIPTILSFVKWCIIGMMISLIIICILFIFIEIKLRKIDKRIDDLVKLKSIKK